MKGGLKFFRKNDTPIHSESVDSSFIGVNFGIFIPAMTMLLDRDITVTYYRTDRGALDRKRSY